VKFFLRRLGKPVASIQTAIQLRPNTLEANCLHRNVCENLTFAMMIKKIETSFGVGPRGRKTRI